jgi:hypothetical protein
MEEKTYGRNEPCPCGSGSKYKRCCGKDAAPKLGKPADLQKRGAGLVPPGAGAGQFDPSQFDPSKLDPAMMAQFNQALMRMPRGQLQKLQSVMQRAMSGQDVSREAAELDRLMPPELKQLAASMGMGMGMPAPAPAAESAMSETDARKIIEQAAAKGEITKEEAERLLAGNTSAAGPAPSGKFSQLWKKVTGK